MARHSLATAGNGQRPAAPPDPAARYGLEDDLVDVVGERLLPAPELLRVLLDFVRPALEDHGEWDDASELVDRLLKEGTGAARQREAFEREDRLEDVVDFVVEATKAPDGG
jgi:carboxylate-amine ligase